jgi:hypothetical protein
MKSSTRLYAWLKLLAVLHLVEQLIFGMQDLYRLQRMISIFESWFANTTVAMTVLITIIMALVVLGARCIINGGFARFITMFVLGLPTLGELHHVIETMRALHYTAGTVTAVPSTICGVLFLRALFRENSLPKSTRVEVPLKLRVA